jgi:hypothetical protein
VLMPRTSVDLNFDSVFRLKNAMAFFRDARRACNFRSVGRDLGLGAVKMRDSLAISFLLELRVHGSYESAFTISKNCNFCVEVR